MRKIIAALVLAAVAACSPAGQSDADKEKAQPAPATTAEQPAVDPQVMAALERMGAYLRTLQSFEVRARTSIDEVLIDTEQKVQFAGDGLYRIRRPNAFYLEANTDRRQRRLYYDGQNFTLYSPRMHVYAQRPAPGTIREAVTELQDRYNVPVPLADLFYWGTEEADPTAFALASHIGFARINGQDADHFAFRQGDLDWQIWIARGDRPLPLKVVITTRTEPGQPQYTSELTWNLEPRFTDATFAFRPPADAHLIEIQEVQNAQQ